MSELVNEFEIGFCDSLTEFDVDDKIEFLTWISDEYKNFMMISRDDYIANLDKYLDEVEGVKIYKFIRDNIERYGAVKAFYFAANKMLNKLEQKDNK